MFEQLKTIDWAQWLPLVGVFAAIAIVVFVLTRWLSRTVLGSTQNQTNRLSIGPPPNALGSLTLPLSYVFPHTAAKREKIQRELSEAGHHHSNALINFLALRNVALMAWLSLLAMAFTSGLADGQEIKVLAIGVAIAIFVHSVPRIVLSSQAASRVRRIEQGLPDALDMLAMSVEGGLPLGRSLDRVADELGPTHVALSEELQIIARQSATGSFDQALKSFADRVRIPDLMAWSAMMQQSQRLGGNVVTGLREYADRIRANRKQRAERIGQTASLKLLLPVVLCLTPPVFVVLVGPAMLDFRDFIQRERENHSVMIQQANVPQAARLQDAILGDG